MGTLPALMPEIAAAAVGLASEMAFATFARELLGDIRRDAAYWRLERALGFIVKMLRHGTGFGHIGRRF